ncbi:MAG: Wzz/FepE/Etk N-terminal domain-containing protein [Chloroflexota bacterium]
MVRTVTDSSTQAGAASAPGWGAGLRLWLWLVPVGALLLGALSYVVSTLIPPTYAATATVLVQQQATSVSGPQYQDVLASERLARTYAQMVLTQPVLEPVAKRGQTTVEELRKRVSTRVPLETQLIQITAEDRTAADAQAIASQVAASFMEQARGASVSTLVASKENLKRQLERLNAELDELAIDVDRLRSAVLAGRATPQDTALLQQLQAQLGQAQANHTALLRTLNDVELAETKAAEGLRLVDPATEPTRPVRPNSMLVTLAGALVGACAAAGLAWLISGTASRLAESSDAPAPAAPAPQTAAIQPVPAQAAAELSPSTPAPVAEPEPPEPVLETRTIHSAEPANALAEPTTWSLVNKLRQFPAQSVVVTSAGSRDSTASVAVQFGLSIAETGKRVLIVDANLQEPSIHELFGVPNARGLSDLLNGRCQTVEEVLAATAVPNVSIVSGGAPDLHAADLLTSDWMRVLLKSLHPYADVVVLDSPPITRQRDGLELASLTDAAVLVVDRGAANGVLALRGQEALEEAGAILLGVLEEDPSSPTPGIEAYAAQPSRSAAENLLSASETPTLTSETLTADANRSEVRC